MVDQLCISLDAEVKELKRRCGEKEREIKRGAISVAKLEATIVEIKKDCEMLSTQVIALREWKNKALGYLGGIGFITLLIIEFVKDRLFT